MRLRTDVPGALAVCLTLNEAIRQFLAVSSIHADKKASMSWRLCFQKERNQRKCDDASLVGIDARSRGIISNRHGARQLRHTQLVIEPS